MKQRLGVAVVVAAAAGLLFVGRLLLGSVGFGQQLDEEVVQRLKDFAVAVGRQVEIVVHVQMGNAAVRQDEIRGRIDQLDASHQRRLVGQQLVDLGVALTQRIDQMSARQQRLTDKKKKINNQINKIK